jgi:hypothetical protein
MTDKKVTEFTADTSPTTDDLIDTVNDPGGTPANKKVTLADLKTLMQQGLTRFVVLDSVEVLSTNPADTNYTDCDVTSVTSATCYAVTGAVRYTTGATIRSVVLRPNGSSSTAMSIRIGASDTYAAGFVVGVDAGQIFEWSVSNADVTSLVITLTGYWDTIP